MSKRFFDVEDGGASYTIVALDLEHAKQILRDHGVEFTKDDGNTAPIDDSAFADLEWCERSPEGRHVFLDDGCNRIALADATLGDFFCSEY